MTYNQSYVTMSKNYPEHSKILRIGRQYQVITSLDIGYFVLCAGRLVFLPLSLQNEFYTKEVVPIHYEYP